MSLAYFLLYYRIGQYGRMMGTVFLESSESVLPLSAEVWLVIAHIAETVQVKNQVYDFELLAAAFELMVL